MTRKNNASWPLPPLSGGRADGSGGDAMGLGRTHRTELLRQKNEKNTRKIYKTDIPI